MNDFHVDGEGQAEPRRLVPEGWSLALQGRRRRRGRRKSRREGVAKKWREQKEEGKEAGRRLRGDDEEG